MPSRTGTKTINPYSVLEPMVFALTKNRFLASLATRAQSVEDVVDIIGGKSPIINNALREARAAKVAKNSPTRTTQRTDKPDAGEVVDKPDDLPGGGSGGSGWSDFVDTVEEWGGDTIEEYLKDKWNLTGYFGSDATRDMLEQLGAVIMISQLRDVFGVGEGEFNYAETLESAYLAETNKILGEIGFLYDNYKTQYGDLDTLTRSAQAMFERGMGRIRTEAEGAKDNTVARLSSMGLGREVIAANLRSIDDEVLSQTAEAQQNAEIFNENIRSRMEQNMSNMLRFQNEVDRNFFDVAQVHNQLGVMDTQAISDIIESLVSKYYSKADVNVVDVDQTVTTGDEGGRFGLRTPLTRRGEQVAQKPEATPEIDQGFEVRKVVIDGNGMPRVVDGGRITPPQGVQPPLEGGVSAQVGPATGGTIAGGNVPAVTPAGGDRSLSQRVTDRVQQTVPVSPIEPATSGEVVYNWDQTAGTFKKQKRRV